jgi:hypothetical protein
MHLPKGRTIRKVMGVGGDFLRGNIYFFGHLYIEEIFFSHLMAGNIFLSEIYRPIFQARIFFCTMPGKIFFS